MNDLNRTTGKRLDRQSIPDRKLAPLIEVMESRQLMTGGCATGFLTGSVLLDHSSTPVPGVTVELFQACNSTKPLCTQTTGLNGQYLFNGLQPGDYLLKEVAPAGYSASGVNPVSQLDPAWAVGNDTIKVTVVDPTKVFVNYGGIAPTSFAVVNDVVKGGKQVNSVGPQADTLGTSAGKADLNAAFYTFCVNDQQSLSFGGGESYQVAPRPISQLNDGTCAVSADHDGRIAYLFNHYGNSPLSNVQGAGLQLAIWELLYDSGNTPDFNAGAFQVSGLYQSVSGETLPQVIAQAQSYFNESAGRSETAVFLDASAYTCSTHGIQSVLAAESLNFSVNTTTTCCDLTNVHYVINGCKTVTCLDGNVHGGDTVEADFTVPAGACDTLSLVSYNADCSFNLVTQTVACSQTQTFGPGCHSLKVSVPNSYFQVDFVCGNVITQFNPGAGVTYHGQNRFIDAARGGPVYCAPVGHDSGSDCGDGDNHRGSVCDTGHHGGGDDKGSVCDTGHHGGGGDDKGSACDTGHHGGGGDDKGSACDDSRAHDFKSSLALFCGQGQSGGSHGSVVDCGGGHDQKGSCHS